MNKEIETRLKKVTKLKAEIEDIRSKCLHHNFKGKYKGNTGNWCPQDDSYWLEVDCLDCGHRFFVDSEEEPELYRKLSKSGRITK